MPILEQNCFECHSHDAGLSRGSLVLDSRKGMLVGGDHGPAIIPSDVSDSLLIKAIRHEHDDIQMPKDAEPLAAEQIAMLERWIDQGAIWPGSDSLDSRVKTDRELADSHWAYQPISSPTPPTDLPQDWNDWARNDIDRFIASDLAERGLDPTPQAPDTTLRRRLSYDLTGLAPDPSAPHDLDDFIESLYRSDEYGRKFARHWLDVARYADTAGDNADFPIPEMSLYRDYIIDAFNDDLPFDELIKEQIAGDLLDSGTNADLRRRRVIATSFIAGSMRYCDDLKKDLPLVIDDTVDAVGQAFLGMTLSCAKCHDHKSEPIPTTDYYALYGFFSSTRFPYAGREGRQVPVNLVPTGLDREANQRILEINQQVYKDLKTGGRIKLDGERGMKIIALLKEQRRLGELAFGVRDQPDPADAHVHFKGDPKKKRQEVPRGFFSVITPNDAPDIREGESGRRQLAEWIASDDHPLTARVITNRVWSWHFGRGLVATPNNFGISGARPSHPELLDYLTRYFIESDWSIRELSRFITQSATYRQASNRSGGGHSRRLMLDDEDHSNVPYLTASRRRLTAEEIRDSSLSVAGLLDPANPGPHPFPTLGEMRFTQHNPYAASYTHNHRSIFLMTSRIRRQEFTSLFDAADPTNSTGQRRNSTVPLQALYLLNNERFNQIVDAFGERLAATDRASGDAIAQAITLCYSRPPRPNELQLLRSFVDTADTSSRSAWSQLAHALLLSNEFIYLD